MYTSLQKLAGAGEPLGKRRAKGTTLPMPGGRHLDRAAGAAKRLFGIPNQLSWLLGQVSSIL